MQIENSLADSMIDFHLNLRQRSKESTFNEEWTSILSNNRPYEDDVQTRNRFLDQG